MRASSWMLAMLFLFIYFNLNGACIGDFFVIYCSAPWACQCVLFFVYVIVLNDLLAIHHLLSSKFVNKKKYLKMYI